jgi:predicted nucleic acid-binding protein
MKVLFDTSVLVTAVVDQLPNHAASLACYRHSRGGKGRDAGLCTAHALAEAYATLTRLPLSPRIQPTDAARLIRTNFDRDLTVVGATREDYDEAIDRVARLGLASGVIYDALHLIAAERLRCERLYTFNLRDFERLEPKRVRIMAP